MVTLVKHVFKEMLISTEKMLNKHNNQVNHVMLEGGKFKDKIIGHISHRKQKTNSSEP